MCASVQDPDPVIVYAPAGSVLPVTKSTKPSCVGTKQVGDYVTAGPTDRPDYLGLWEEHN